MINLFSKIHDLQCVSHKYHRIKNKKNMSLLLVGHSSSFSINAVDYTYLVGGFSPSEKYESQWEGLSHILWKIKNVPNNQPVMGCITHVFCVSIPYKIEFACKI